MDIIDQFSKRISPAKCCANCRWFDCIEDDDRDEHCFVCLVFTPDLFEVDPCSVCPDFEDGSLEFEDLAGHPQFWDEMQN